MPIERSVVHSIAALARLRVEPGEEERLARELGSILEYVDQLQALDVTNVEPTTQITTGAPTELRPDVERVSDVRDEALGSAADRDGDYFRVPRVV